MEESVLYVDMNEHGLLQVVHAARANVRVMLQDLVVRGMQSADPAREDEPLAYYERTGCIGSVLGAWGPATGGRRVGIVGLGAGSIAAYARPGEHFTFFEADPRVAALAADGGLFTFLRRCRGTHEIVVGDVRERLEQVADGTFDLLVVDALAGASVEAELASRDALDRVRRKLAPDGLLLVLGDTASALLSACRDLAHAAGMGFRDRADPATTDADRARGKMPACCLALARDESLLRWLPDAAPASAEAGIDAEATTDGPLARPDDARFYPPLQGRAVLQVKRDPQRPDFRVLFCDGTRHGMQSLDPARADEPVGYYDRAAPFGDLFAGWNPPGRAHAAVVGLGVGVLAAYAKPGQRFTFFEIDPRIADIARDPSLFTYLSRCRGTTEVVLGDGRESLERAAEGAFDLVVLDAFVGSYIPPQFLSADALGLCRRKLAPDGLVVFHINWDGSQLPMLRQLARDAGMSCSDRSGVHLTEADVARGQKESHVVVLAREAGLVPWLRDDPRWTTV